MDSIRADGGRGDCGGGVMASFVCAQCGKAGKKRLGDINRAAKSGSPLFCGRKCFGRSRRLYKTKAQKIEEKRLYDIAYCARNRERRKAQKAAYHKRTYDPVKAAIVRKRRMPQHIEYCRRPEYKHWKSGYDRQYKAKKDYGPFAEVAMLAADLNREIKGRMSNHEIKWQNKTSNKSQFRAREAKEEERSRPRGRHRRRDHQATVS
jgi:hypothetical protein